MEKINANNKKAFYEYFILDKLECGLVLTGTEIKAIRQGKVNIKEAYVQIKNNECWIIGMNISEFEQGNRFNHDPIRTRKLLLHDYEIRKWNKQVMLQGHTIVPLSLYLKDGKAKLEIGLAKGKKLYDKREVQKERDIKQFVEKQYKIR